MRLRLLAPAAFMFTALMGTGPVVPSLQRPAGIAVLGDSVAHGAGDESGRGISGNLAMLHARTINLGINGARTWDVLSALRGNATVRSVIHAADDVVISIGGNDLFGDGRARLLAGLAPAMAMRFALVRIRSIVAQIHILNPRARIYLLGLYNPYRRSSMAAWLDRQIAMWDSRLIAAFASDPAVDVVRIADLFAFTNRLSSLDHFHPNAVAYARIAQRIAQTR